MRDMRSGLDSFRAAGMSLIMTLVVCGTAFGQMIEVSGRVTSQAGLPLPGVTVRIRGTDTGTTTDGEGRYSLAAPSDGVVVFALTGYRGVGQTIRGRTIIDVALEPAIAVLAETVVTGYTTQRRADMTGAVATAETVRALEFLARVLSHIPNKGQVLQRASSGSLSNRT